MTAEQVWPSVGWEEHPWVSSLPSELVSRRVRERHAGPFRAAIVPPIATLDVPLPMSVVSLAEDAAIDVARFDAGFGHEIAPFAALLLRSESASSSQIENLTSGARAIALADLGEPSKYNATQIVANVHAMQAAIDLADQLDAASILAMHQALMEHDHADIAGRWRTAQVWIGGSNFGPHDAAFVPPHHTHVPEAIEDLMRFIRRNDVPALVQAAVAHAQFETIHPFPDGNGRTGRALIHSILRARGLTRGVTVPVSAGLLHDVDAYFDALTAYRAGDPTQIVKVFAEASFGALTNGYQLVADIRAIRKRWTEVITARKDAIIWRVAELLLRQPVINAEAAIRELGAGAANVHRALDQLTAVGILKEFSGKKRNRLWQAREVLDALDEFALRAGRRRLAEEE